MGKSSRLTPHLDQNPMEEHGWKNTHLGLDEQKHPRPTWRLCIVQPCLPFFNVGSTTYLEGRVVPYLCESGRMQMRPQRSAFIFPVCRSSILWHAEQAMNNIKK